MFAPPMAAKKRVFKVLFIGQGKTYELYARSVAQGTLFGFVELEGLLFGERSSVIVDPSEDALQREFAGVERIFLPLHAVLRIDEVEKRGAARIHAAPDAAGKVTPLPTPVFTQVKS